MDVVDTYYAKTPDGVSIAYQVIGDGPIDVVSQTDWPGNIDFELEEPLGAAWASALSSFARVIYHDRRGIGLSSRNVDLPNLETRVADLLTVLDDVGSERPVLAGAFESGSPNALLAATRPDRVGSIVWMDPSPRFAWAPDYPWGRTDEDIARELEDIEHWGTREYGRRFFGDEATRGNEFAVDGSGWIVRASRNACTPDVAKELAKIWYESDVRGVLPSIQVPTLIMSKVDRVDAEQADYVRSLIPGAEFLAFPPGPWTIDDMRWAAEQVRIFAGVERAPSPFDSILATVLFTDIVGSTEKQATLGDHAWKDLAERHHAIVRDSLARWRGVEIDTAGDGFYATFDGPARAVRAAQEVGRRVRDLGIEIRAGVHTGECEVIDGKVGGLAVSIGARVASKAAPSDVLVSQTVKDLTAGSGFAFEDAGEHELKGVPDRWHLYRVVSST